MNRLLKNFVSMALIAVQAVAVTPLYAQATNDLPMTLPAPPPLAPGEVDVGAAISPMRRGQLAVFTGVLLSPLAVATVVAELNSIQERINLEIDRTEAVERASCQFKLDEAKNAHETDKKIFFAQIEAKDKYIITLNDVIKENESNTPNTPLWVGLGIGAGFLAGVAATVVTVYAVNQVSN